MTVNNSGGANAQPALRLSHAKRILLSALHWMHWGTLFYGSLGWLIPDATALYVHLGFVSLMLLSWLVNRDTCILDNIRSLIMTGEWRAKSANPEEGRWIASQIERITGLSVPTWAANIVIYLMIIVLGALSAWHLSMLD